MISREKADLIRSLADADGFIEPENVINEARRPRSLIHEDFDWDIDSAAHSHWLDTARRLIRFVKLEFIIEARTLTSVAYVVDPDRPAKSKRYVDITIAASNREKSHAILLAEMMRITAAIRRAQQVANALGLRPQLDLMLSNVEVMVREADAAVRRARKAASARGKKRKVRRKTHAPGEAHA